ncbi:MAG: methionine--tRNA ligase [Armatimonadetes bacterium]|nr:methionine--tRNA ligase [Armatimonadota bacterium]
MSSEKAYYITTPIYYVNSSPHIGSTLTTLAADMLARYQKMQGRRVWFLTGTDENAIKVHRAAQERGMPTQQFVDELAAEFQQAWKTMHIEYDDFIRTTEPRHVRVVQEFFRRMQERGDIYKGVYEGWYCVSDETFFAPSDVGEDRLCPNAECRRPLQWVQEEDYFFRLSAYGDRLLQYIEEHPDWLEPEFRKNEVVAFIKQGLRDQSVTRANPGWGIPVPGEPDKVIYVWFDALINYVSATGWPDDIERYQQLWPAVHLMGKEIFVRFHATLWPAMLMSLGLPVPERLFGHGWWTIGGEKGSKSKGNLPHPVQLARDIAAWSGAEFELAVDAERYLLIREMQFGLDSEFSEESFRKRYNSDLANDLGNLLNRTLNMVWRYAEGRVPKPLERNAELATLAEDIDRGIAEEVYRFRLNGVLEQVWRMVSRLNKYLDEQAPWSLYRNGETERAGSVLYDVLEGVRLCALWLAPTMPVATARIWEQLGIGREPVRARWQEESQWGRLQPDTSVQQPQPLFPRITEEALKAASQKETDMEQSQLVSIEDFQRLEIRIAEVKMAEAIPNTSKLLKLTVDLGGEERTLVAGIAETYRPEDVVGRQIVVLANLQPATIRGVQSQGMLLAAEVDGKAILLTPDKPVPVGSKVR